MKSMRFVTVVEKAGKPDVHLMLVEPEKDVVLQRAIKTNRVMTLHQTGTSDFGLIGFEKGVAGQILVFPKSLKSFEGSRIVGVKYDLLKGASAPKAKPAVPHKGSKMTAPRKSSVRPPSPEIPSSEKVVAFKRLEPEENDEEGNHRVSDLEAGIHHAMELLEQGKQVAAFNILKRLVD